MLINLANARFPGPLSCKNLTGGRLHFQNDAITTEMLGFVVLSPNCCKGHRKKGISVEYFFDALNMYFLILTDFFWCLKYVVFDPSPCKLVDMKDFHIRVPVDLQRRFTEGASKMAAPAPQVGRTTMEAFATEAGGAWGGGWRRKGEAVASQSLAAWLNYEHLARCGEGKRKKNRLWQSWAR